MKWLKLFEEYSQLDLFPNLPPVAAKPIRLEPGAPKEPSIFKSKLHQPTLFPMDDTPHEIAKDYIRKFHVPGSTAISSKFRSLADVLAYFNSDARCDILVRVIEDNAMKNHESFSVAYCAFLKQFTPDNDTRYVDDEYIQERIDILEQNHLRVMNEEPELLKRFLLTCSPKQLSPYFAWEEYDKLVKVITDAIARGENTLPVYRAVELPKSLEVLKGFIKQYKGVGAYWSHNYDLAKTYWNRIEGHTIVLCARVDVRNVNWSETFFKSLYYLSNEEEIEIRTHATVALDSIKIKGDTMEELQNAHANWFMFSVDPRYRRPTYLAKKDHLATIKFPIPMNISV